MSCGSINIYNYSVSGDCTNSGFGGVSFSITGGSPNYTVSEISTSGLLPLSSNTTTYFVTGLTPDTYILEIIDSCLEPPFIPRYVEFTISSGTCVSIESSGTTCGLNNGTITASTTNYYGVGSFYLYENTLGYITSGDSTSNVFTNLSPGLYYVIGDDGGGCTGRSEVCLIKETSPLDFGLYVVNDASCVPIDGTGKIFVTGLTGNPPYTYSWSPNVGTQTGPEVTGLTLGTYTLTITDFEGCTITKSVVLSDVPDLGVAAMLTTIQPSCFSNDGEVEVIVSGGTAPYYFSGSNGEITIQYSNIYTFTGLSSGVFTVSVTDAGLCNVISSVSLLTPNGFIVTTMSVTNSNCNSSDGSVHIELNNGLSPGNYQYTLYDFNGNSTVTTTNSICDFFGLESGSYTILIQDVPNNSGCIYTGHFTVVNVNKYEISVSYSDTTCGLNNGTAIITATSGGTLPLSYNLSGGTPVTTTTQLTNVFNNLSSGFYVATVTDSGSPTCTQTENFYIADSQPVDFTLVGVQPTIGNDGEIYLNITSGVPPFTIVWSSNVGAQTGLHLTGLSNGNYSVLVTDSEGCLKSDTIILNGTELTTSYASYTVCSDDFVNTGIYGKRGILQMMNEGFFDLTSGDIGCYIVNATFRTQVEIDGVIKEDLFYTYTGGSFAQYADTIWIQSLKDTIQEYPEIGDVIIDLGKNKITITNNCNEKIKDCQLTNFNDLGDTNVKINLLIEYLISCKDCGKAPECLGFNADMTLVGPTLTPTPTVTPTPTLTPTATPATIMCFTVNTDLMVLPSWDCSLNPVGIINGKPYYIIYQSDCTTSCNSIVYWNDITNRWEHVNISAPTIILQHNDNPSYFPESNVTYPWVTDLMIAFGCVIEDSTLGNCLNPTPTPTVTPTPTQTPAFPCDCYELSGGSASTGSTFSYTDCKPIPQGVGVGRGATTYVCASTVPTLDSGTGGYSLSLYTCVADVCGPPVTPTPSPIPPTPPNLLTCDIMTSFYLDNSIYVYYPLTNTNILLTPFISGTLDAGPGDIAHTSNKMWLSYASTSAITEYDIILSPFSGSYNRNIVISNCTIGAGLTAIDDTTLITTTGVTNFSTPQTVVEIDISGVSPIVTNKFNIPAGRTISGDFIYTTSNKLILTTQIGFDRYISQYDYSTGTLEFDQLISPTILNPYGLFTDSGKIHILNNGGEVYQIDENSPYSLTYLQTATIPFGGASQISSCETISFIP